MQLAHAVDVRGEADGEDGEVELAALGAEGEGGLGIGAHVLGPRAEVAPHELAVVGLVAGGDRGVGGEDRVARHRLEGVLEPFARLHSLPRALEAEEGDVSLVHVPHGRREAERAQGPHAADAEDDLLGEAHLAAAYIEDARDRPVGGVVQGDVGVQHQDGHQPDLRLPHRGLDDTSGQVDGHRQHAAAGRLHGQHRQAGEVVVGIDVLLEAVGVDRLAEISGAIQQPHADERHAEIAGRLAVVSGEDAQAAGVDAQRLVEAELHREVRDGTRQGRALLLVPARPRPIRVERVDDGLVGVAELGVGQQTDPVMGLDVDQQLDRVVVTAPVVGIDPREEARRQRRPAPPEVVGQLAQPVHALGQLDVGDLQRGDAQGSAHGIGHGRGRMAHASGDPTKRSIVTAA